MTTPLDGIRVIDWTIWQQGPVCSTMLADLGADVIKIEERESGDPGRGILSMSGVSLEDRPNFYFEANNRNKRSVTLDLKTPEGRELMLQLLDEADVFVQNFRLGVADRLGFDYETVHARNPRLIYACATGYGPEGRDAAEPSFDWLGLARSGLMLAAGDPDMPPLGIAGGIADQMGAIMLAYGVLAAIIAREKTGEGQRVDSSHLGSMIALQGLSVSAKLMMGWPLGRQYRSQAGNPLWNHYRCRDDKWIALAMLQPDRYWSDFCNAIERPELAADPRYTDLRSRGQNAESCVAELDAVFVQKDRAEWLHLLSEKQGDFIYTVVNSVDDLPEDPQVTANDYVVDFEHPQHGKTQVLGMPVGLSDTPGTIRLAAPELGQHTEEVLLEVLGLDWDRISALRESGVI